VRETRDAVLSSRLYRCLTCDAITHWHTPLEWLRPGGKLYQLALTTNKGPLTESKKFSFPNEGREGVY
jgi:deubiquitinating protein VCIP135